MHNEYIITNDTEHDMAVRRADELGALHYRFDEEEVEMERLITAISTYEIERWPDVETDEWPALRVPVSAPAEMPAWPLALIVCVSALAAVVYHFLIDRHQ